MKLTSIIPALVLFISPIALVSCGEKEGSSEEGSAPESAAAAIKSHNEVGEEMAAIMTDMINGMSTVKDVASAEAFAATIPDLKERMKKILTAAKALPAPTEEEKAAVNKAMDDAQKKAGPVLMATMMGMSENPDAEAIGKIMEGVMQDDEMDNVGGELEAIYNSGESETVAPETE